MCGAGISTSSCWPIAGGRPTSLFEKWTRCRGEVPFPEEDLPAVLQVFVRTYSHAEGHWIQYTEKLLPAAINGASLPFRAHSARRFAQRWPTTSWGSFSPRSQRNRNSSSSPVVGGARLGLPLRQRNAFNTNVANQRIARSARGRGLRGYAAGMGLLTFPNSVNRM